MVGPLEPEVEAEVAKVDARVLRADSPDGAPLQGFQRATSPSRAAAAAALLGELDDAAVLRAASAVTVPGRFEVVGEAPLTIYDGAHNPSGIAALASALREVVGGRPLIARAVACSTTRTRPGCCASSSTCARGAVFTASQNPRALSPATLASLWSQLSGPPAQIEAQPHAAVRLARELAGEDGAVVATGSIYLVADLLARSRAPAGGRRCERATARACCRWSRSSRSSSRS